MDADSVGRPGTGTKGGFGVVGAVAVESCMDGWEESEEGEEVHFGGTLGGILCLGICEDGEENLD